MEGASLITLSTPVGGDEWLRAAGRARRLASISLAWLCFEGAATTTAGLLAGSIALVGNGLDGAIEGLASIIVVWRFTGSRTLSTTSERRAQQLVALSFFLLAPYIAFEASRALIVEHHAETTWLGIGLSIGTLCVCPWLGRAKLRLGEQLGSPGHRRIRTAEPHLLLPRNRCACRTASQHTPRDLVARSPGRARHGRPRHRRGSPRMARPVMRLHDLLGHAAHIAGLLAPRRPQEVQPAASVCS